MAIKKLRFSFDIPITELLALVATRNDALQIDVVGDNKEPRKLPKAQAGIAGLLEGPDSKRGSGSGNRGADEKGPITGYLAIAIQIMKTPQAKFTPKEFRDVLSGVGLNPNSVSPQISVMKKEGYIKETGERGEYHVTPNGARHFQKLIKEREAHLTTSKGNGK